MITYIGSSLKMVNISSGRVAFVGAGPGAPDLITVRGLRLLQAADVVIHDSLPGDALLAECSATARIIAVGKRCGLHSATQEEINTILAHEARRSGLVVRLKGGDPGVFGRLGEEIDHLAAEGIPFEIVPGVTAATAAGAESGFPLTHRGKAASVTFLTGHCADGCHALFIHGSEVITQCGSEINCRRGGAHFTHPFTFENFAARSVGCFNHASSLSEGRSGCG